MKRLIICTAAAAAVAAGTASGAKRVPSRVQGTDYAATLRHEKKSVSPAWEWDPNPDSPALPDGEFSMDDIQNWTGEGSNRAALVIQWNDPREQYALVFGYRWDGLATGADMIKAVVKNNPRLYTLMQYTNVSSPTDPLGGYTINGFGWDVDNDGDNALYDEENNDYYGPEYSDNGFFEHPRGYNPEVGGSSDYDYDNWKAVDADDFWQAGWYIGYWSYWVKGSADSNFGYSGWGASGRVLDDGSWDGWNYAVDMLASDWKEFKSAPPTVPDGAKTEFAAGDFFYKLADYANGTVTLVHPSDIEGIEGATYREFTGEALVIPTSFYDEGEDKTYTVIAIGDNAFEGVEGITSVTLPATVKKIGNAAFMGCLDLEEVKYADGSDPAAVLTSIGTEAFSSCPRFKTVIFPLAMKAMPAGIYSGCLLTEEIAIPEHVEEIGDNAFAYTGLKSLEIPANVKKIGSKAFAATGLNAVRSESLYPAEAADDAFGEAAASATLTVPAGFKEKYAESAGWQKFGTIEEFFSAVNVGDVFEAGGITYTVTDASEDTPSLRVRYAKVEGKADRASITAANKAAYTGDLTIPAKVSFMGREFNVTAMNDSAFYGASELISVKIEAPIEAVGKHAFYECKNLAEVTLPEGLKTIGTYAFSYAGLTSVKLPDSVEAMEERVFFQCNKLTDVKLSASLTSLPRYAFAYCTSLESIEFGDNILELGTNLMQNCTALKSVVLPKNLKTIPSYAFSSCGSLETLVIPESVTEIAASAFANDSKLVVNLPASVTTLGASAFQGCANETFSVPATVTAIPNTLFSGCKNLREVEMSDTVATFGTNVFYNCSALTTLKISGKDSPEGVISFPSALTGIGNYSFSGCSALKRVEIPEGVKTIGSYMFQNCTSLEEAVLPNSCTAMTANMFYGCGSLRKVTLGGAITSVANSMFRDCGSLEIITFKGDDAEPEAGVFRFPDTVTTFGSWIFANCKKLRSVAIPDKVTSIPMNTFDGCSALSEVTLPAGLKTLGNYVFRNTALKELLLTSDVMGSHAYASDIVYGCDDVKVYVCSAAAPFSCGANTWRIAAGKYAEVVVPHGMSQSYAAANGWKNCAISEPEIAGIEVEIEVEDLDDDLVLVNVDCDLAYAGEHPAAFLQANDAEVFTGKSSEFRLEYRPVTTESGRPSIAVCDEGDEEALTEAIALDKEGKGSAVLERPESSASYAVKLAGTHSGIDLASEEQAMTVTGKDVSTAVDMVFGAIEGDTEIYTLGGLRVNNDAQLEPGMYIVRKGGKSCKVKITRR